MKTCITTLDIINGICDQESKSETYANRTTQSNLIEHMNRISEQNHLYKLDEWSSNFCSALQRNDNDIEIIKHRVSAFYETDLDLVLRANKIEHIILCGVATNNAVELTAREAHDRDYHVTIIHDATETSSNAAQEASLNFLSRIANVISTNELIQ